jgi:uncharacterized protein (TIGR03435 family)
MTRALPLTVALLTASFAAFAQNPTFDVVSIKRNTSVLPGPTWGGTPDRWEMINGPVSSLIYTAYNPQVYELPSAPSWVFSEKYDVTARMQGAPDRATQAAMLRSMLADRFRLKARIEMQDRPVYALVVARPGQLGPGLKLSSQQDCTAPDAKCGYSIGSGRIVATGRPLDTLNSISNAAGRIIVDKTGLKGIYDFTLQYSVQSRPEDTPSIFAAIEEQLGLKLVPDRAPLSVVVVDSVERPTPD